MRLTTALWGAFGLAGALLAHPAGAFAQDDDYGDDDDAPVIERPRVELERGGARGAPEVAETHVVRGGDTLWDLCSQYLNSPWYWPKIWSYNPQITNPHWIYPGNELRFYPGDESLPTPVEISRSMTAEGGQDDDSEVRTLDSDDLVRAIGSINVGRVAPNSVNLAFNGFMTKKAIERAGEITNSMEEVQLLSDFDKVYVKTKEQARRGDRYAIYRVVRAIDHPISGEPVGYAGELLGGLQVIDTGSSVSTAQITQAYRPVERGDLVAPWPESFGTRTVPTRNDSEAQGYIVETVGDVVGAIGEHDMVFIDRGRSHGVQRGSVFTVLDRGDLFTRETQGLPNEDVGQLMVMDVQENGATAIVTNALREIQVGDKIEMRRN